MTRNLRHLSARLDWERNVYRRLREAGAKTGTPSDPDIEATAQESLMGSASLMGVASFYDFLKPENAGKQAYVCNGTACLVAGTQESLHRSLVDHLGADRVGHMTCLGRCHENRAFSFRGRNFSGEKANDVASIVAGDCDPARDVYATQSTLTEPILMAPDPDLDHLERLVRRVMERGGREALQEIHLSKLRGRGGAGFPAGIKWQTCRDAAGERKAVVCNADEGDPGAYSDRYLLEQRPLMVLTGMVLAGYVVGAHVGVVYLRAEYPDARTTIEHAIETLAAAGLLGDDILGSGFSFTFHLVTGAGSYICGEETALLNSIEGLRPESRVRPPYPVHDGLFGQPTVVGNVETFACVPFILDRGGQAFAAIGTDESTGPKLVSLNSVFRRPGVFEVPMGTPLNEIVQGLGGGFRKDVKALHVGGPLGGVVPVSGIDRLTLDFESFAREGCLLGHASILAIPETYPMIEYLAHLFEFTAAESCGKCYPCRLGSVRGEELLRGAIDQGRRIDRALFDDLLETLELGSLCGMGGGLPQPVKNILEHFADELAPYWTGGDA